jgi:hypothetical protein
MVLRGQFCKLLNVSVSGGQQRRDDGATFSRYNVAVGATDFWDQPVSPEQS